MNDAEPAKIAVMARLEAPGLIVLGCSECRHGLVRPVERPRHDALVGAAKAQRIVGARAPEPVPPLTARLVEIGTRIDEGRFAIDVEHDGERIRMAMRSNG